MKDGVEERTVKTSSELSSIGVLDSQTLLNNLRDTSTVRIIRNLNAANNCMALNEYFLMMGAYMLYMYSLYIYSVLF